jgi:hypothetical protein
VCTPANACIAVYHSGTQLYLTPPSPLTQGPCPDGQIEITGLTAGDSTGFGGIAGEPNDSFHTFSSALTAVTATGPTVDVKCGGNERNSTTAEAFGSVNMGQTKTDATCVISNTAMSTSNLSITALAVTGCGFSLVSPTTPLASPIGLYYTETQPITLTFSPCGKGAQTATLTITSNGTNGTSGAYSVALTGTGVAAVSLVKGWNLIGLPAVPSNTALSTVLSSIMGNVSVVWAYINGEWMYYDPNDVAGSALKTLTTGNGYWIYMTAAATLTIQ